MPTFQRCDASVPVLATLLMGRYPEHEALVNAGVKIDFVFAYGDRNENEEIVGPALTKGGVQAIGMARKIALKDRALGRADAEISLDGDWWGEAGPEQQAALLDHELYHFCVATDKAGAFKYDDLSRPILKLRPHDHDYGWFTHIAKRHGVFSIELPVALRDALRGVRGSIAFVSQQSTLSNAAAVWKPVLPLGIRDTTCRITNDDAEGRRDTQFPGNSIVGVASGPLRLFSHE